MNKMNPGYFAICLLLLSACNADDEDRPVRFASAIEESASCGQSSVIDPSFSVYSWEKIGETIHGGPPSTSGGSEFENAVGFDVGISRDGRKIVSSIGDERLRSFSLDTNGLEQSETDIDRYYKPQFSLSGNGSVLLQNSESTVTLLTRSNGNDWKIAHEFMGDSDSVANSVAVNSSGTLVAISARNEIRTYELLENGSWRQLEPILGQPGENLGSKLILSNDGRTLFALRAFGINIYKLDVDKWIYQNTDGDEYVFNRYNRGSEDWNYGPPFSTYMAASGNGNVVAVGYVSTNFRTTKDFTVRMFAFEDGAIHPIGQTLHAAHRHDSFGHGLDLNCDGSVVAIGADTKWTLGDESAYVRSFVNIDNAWHQIGEDITFDNQGLGDLAISENGETIIIGQANDYATDVRKLNFYGELRAYELVRSDTE